MNRSLLLASLSLSLPSLACGARSALEQPDVAVGGSGGLGGGGAGGSAGAGGAPVTCTALVLDGPAIRALDPLGPEGHEESPTALALGPSLVAVPFRVASDAALSAVVRAPSFDAWGPWPFDMGPAHDVVAWDFPGYVAAAGWAGDFAVLHGAPALGGNPGAAFADLTPSIEPGTSYPGGAANQFLSTLPPGRPSALSAGPSGLHVMWQQGAADYFFLQQTDVTPPAQEDFPYAESGCATARLRAAALALPSWHLAAFSTGRDWSSCSLDDGVIGPPTRVQVEQWVEGSPALGYEWEGNAEPIANLGLVSRPGGAWVLFQSDGSTSETVPAVVAVPLSSTGEEAGLPVMLVPDGTVFGPLAVGSLGDGFVVGWVDAIDPSAPTVQVRAFHADGSLRAEGSLGTADAFLVGSRVSLAGSPAGDAVVVSWEASDPEGVRVVAARLSCI